MARVLGTRRRPGTAREKVRCRRKGSCRTRRCVCSWILYARAHVRGGEDGKDVGDDDDDGCETRLDDAGAETTFERCHQGGRCRARGFGVIVISGVDVDKEAIVQGASDGASDGGGWVRAARGEEKQNRRRREFIFGGEESDVE